MLGAEIFMVCLLVIGTVILVLATQPEGGTKKACDELHQAKSNGDGFNVKKTAQAA
jgi:hypothetical protein